MSITVTTIIKVAIQMKYKSLTNIILGVYNLPVYNLSVFKSSSIQISQQYSNLPAIFCIKMSQQYSNLPAIFKSPSMSMLVRINLVFGQ